MHTHLCGRGARVRGQQRVAAHAVGGGLLGVEGGGAQQAALAGVRRGRAAVQPAAVLRWARGSMGSGGRRRTVRVRAGQGSGEGRGRGEGVKRLPPSRRCRRRATEQDGSVMLADCLSMAGIRASYLRLAERAPCLQPQVVRRLASPRAAAAGAAKRAAALWLCKQSRGNTRSPYDVKSNEPVRRRVCRHRFGSVTIKDLDASGTIMLWSRGHRTASGAPAVRSRFRPAAAAAAPSLSRGAAGAAATPPQVTCWRGCG